MRLSRYNLQENQVRNMEIAILLDRGVSRSMLRRWFGVSSDTIRNIVRRERRWRLEI